MFKISDMSKEINQNIISVNGVSSVKKGAFEGREDLKNITLPESINIICPDSFARCVNLENITLPKETKQIQARACFAFAYCTSLHEVRLPESLKILSATAFCGCENLKRIYLPQITAIIGDKSGELQLCGNTEIIRV